MSKSVASWLVTLFNASDIRRWTDPYIFGEARGALDGRPDVPQTVHVHVNCGVMTLTGSVRLPSERAAAEDAVRGIEGIRRLVNKITMAQIVSAEGLEAPEKV